MPNPRPTTNRAGLLAVIMAAAGASSSEAGIARVHNEVTTSEHLGNCATCGARLGLDFLRPVNGLLECLDAASCTDRRRAQGR